MTLRPHNPAATSFKVLCSSLFFFLFLSLDAFSADFVPPLIEITDPLTKAIEEGVDPDDYLDGVEESNPRPSANQDTHALPFENFNSGITTTSIGTNDTAARASVIQTNGAIVAVGRVFNGVDNDFAITRFNPDGSLDTSFFTSGKTNISFGSSSGDDLAHAVALQTDGKLIVVGRTDVGATKLFQFAVARFTTGGSLDTSFNTTGKLSFSVEDNVNIARAVAIQADGKIVIAGYAWLFGIWDFAAARLNSDGSFDTSFNQNGRFQQPINGSSSAALAVTISSDASIVLGGEVYNGSNWDFAVMKLDTSAQNVVTGFTAVGSGDDTAYAIATQPDNRWILAGGSYNGSNWDYAVVRFNTDGTLDTGFHTNGKVVTTIGTGGEKAFGIQLQTDGKMLLAGYSYNGNDNDFSLVRYKTDGTLDTSFNTNGKVTTSISSGGDDVAQSIAMLGDGYIVVAGRSMNGSYYNFAAARYNTDGSLAVSGTLDLSFGTKGLKIQNINVIDELSGLAFQSDGKIMATGQSGNANPTFTVGRFLVNGTVDTTFNTSGFNNGYRFGTGGEFPNAIAIQPNGKSVIAGYWAPTGGITDYGAIRYNTDGSLDTSFNSSGVLTGSWSGTTSQINTIVLQTDGNLLFAGISGNLFALVRYLSDGTLDTTFSTTAKLTTASTANAHAGILQTDGKILLDGGNNFRVVRYLSSGNLDTTFGTTGIATSSFGTAADIAQAIARQPDGKILSGGSSSNAGKNNFALARFNTDGTYDTSFNTTGKVSTAIGTASDIAYGVGVLSGGKIILAGQVTKADLDVAIARYTSDGVLDTTFKTAGILTASLSVAGTDIYTSIAIQTDGKIVAGGRAAFDWVIARYWP